MVQKSNKGMADQRKYQQIKKHLLESIASGEYPVGEKIPTETELEEKFGMSRGTIRKAILALMEDAIVSRRPGIGTFVIRKPVTGSQILSFTAQIQSLKMQASTKLISAEPTWIGEAEDWVKEAFRPVAGTKSNTFLYKIERIRYADRLPVCWQINYILQSNFKEEFFQSDFTGSLFDLYQKYGQQVSWADEVIQARMATPEEIKHLELGETPPDQRIVYIRQRISYNQANTPIEVVISHDRGDFFKQYHYRIQEEYLP